MTTSLEEIIEGMQNANATSTNGAVYGDDDFANVVNEQTNGGEVVTEVKGCMDATATNYDSTATTP